MTPSTGTPQWQHTVQPPHTRHYHTGGKPDVGGPGQVCVEHYRVWPDRAAQPGRAV
jgi:hypothetical protein